MFLNIEFSWPRGLKRSWTQSSLLVRFVSESEFGPIGFHDHAASLANTASFLSRDPSDPLRGNGAVAAFLQQAGPSAPPAEIPSDVSAQCRLRCCRLHLGAFVCHHGRPATHQQDRNSAVQRYLPVLAGPLAVSRPVYPAPIPQRDESAVRPPTRHLARPIARSTISSAQTADYPHFRSGFRSPDRLWQTAICPRGLQPQETGPTFLPPARLLRGSFAGVLAWLSTTRQYRDGHWLGGLCAALFRQSALLHRMVPSPRPGRFRMLRQAAGGIPRYTRVWLHRRGQGVLAYQEERPQLPIPEVGLGVGGGRVPLSTPLLEAPLTALWWYVVPFPRTRSKPGS